jgi:hypothetical protein
MKQVVFVCCFFISLFLHPEVGGNVFIRNVGKGVCQTRRRNAPDILCLCLESNIIFLVDRAVG